jgi:hypothetical protein
MALLPLYGLARPYYEAYVFPVGVSLYATAIFPAVNHFLPGKLPPPVR